MLIAPIMMVMQSSVIIAILMGRDSGWKPQRRDGGGLVARRDLPRPSLAHGERRGAGGCRLCGLADDARLAVAGDRRASLRRADLGPDRLDARRRLDGSATGCCARPRSTRSPPSGALPIAAAPSTAPPSRRRPTSAASSATTSAGGLTWRWSRAPTSGRAARSIRSRRSPPSRSPRPAPSTRRSPISAPEEQAFALATPSLFERLGALSQDRPAA